MNTTHVNGITTHIGEIPPEGDQSRAAGTVVLIHGIVPDSMASWYLTLAYPLARAGLRVLLYDLRGHGRSQRPAHGYRFADFLDDLDALMTEWKVTEPVFLMGNSLGGALAFGYAARHPERVAGIVAIEAEAPTEGYFARLSSLVDSLTLVSDNGRQAVRGPSEVLHAPQVLALFAETSIRRELPAGPPPDLSLLAAVDRPVLCLYGRESPLRRRAPEIRRLLPQTRTVVFADQKHTLLVDNHQEVRERVLAWLSPQLGGASAGAADHRAPHGCTA
ncbi:alpha/beta fold hydrolase [Streptomyces sp. NPDC088560]|uniref:alpha/beta fold hydrolase n=1 Tax=Streptomyces sp. NPDC088560 TaxID=3365868 RepID=UPI0038073BE3